MFGKGTGDPTAEGERLAKAASEAVPCGPCPFSPWDCITPLNVDTTFHCPNKDTFESERGIDDSYLGTSVIKWLPQANQDVSPQQCHPIFGAWENPVRALPWNFHHMI